MIMNHMLDGEYSEYLTFSIITMLSMNIEIFLVNVILEMKAHLSGNMNINPSDTLITKIMCCCFWLNFSSFSKEFGGSEFH